MDRAYVNAELAQVAAVLLDELAIRRVINGHRGLRRVGLQVPHARCYALPRAALEHLVERDELRRDELGIELDSLPAHVALVTGDRAALAALAPAAWSQTWRAVFHARIHQVLEEKIVHGGLPAAAIRERIQRIGPLEFDEIRTVLHQEDLLLPPVDEATTYVEFVAMYLELQHFAPGLLAQTFPVLAEHPDIDTTIALDVDAVAVLAASRPASAPERPVITAGPSPAVTGPEPGAEIIEPGAIKHAATARGRGNRARAAILAARGGDRSLAREDHGELAARLSRALGDADPAGWVDALEPVVVLAASQRLLRFSVAARLLHDLQSACVVAERETKVVDLFTWARTRGARPIVRALPATREVRIARHVRAAVRKLDRCDLTSSADRKRLGEALHAMEAAADASVRAGVRPKIERALRGVELEPHGLAEEVAEKKLVDELLDRAVEIGRLSLGDLRDAISRNDVKMHDLRLAELRKGDALLRCDRILSVALDGVHRRGEAYTRFLQKLSSVLFGTPFGRLLTLYLLLPALGAFAVLEGLQHMVEPVSVRLFQLEPLIATPLAFAIGTAFLFLMLHVPRARRATLFGARLLWRGIRMPLFDLPRAVWRHPLVRRALASRFTRWVIRPALPAAIAAVLPLGRARWPVAAVVYVTVALVSNLPHWRAMEERVEDWLVRSTRQVAGTIVPGLVKYILDLFGRFIDLFDRGVYRVDQWLRFRSGQASLLLVVKGALGTIWSVITYVLRLYINLFFEPTVNPIKHFPVVTVAAKIMLPFTPAILDGIATPSAKLLGPALGNAFAAFTVLLLPGFAGFLVWELKENWKLYGATRQEQMRALAIGHHGESMFGLLAPGLHSGTIPKHFTKLRRAAWRGDEHAFAKQQEGLHHVEEVIAKFVDRQLVSMLNEAPGFSASDVISTHVEIGSNRVQIGLACSSVSTEHATIRFEQQSRWLVASLSTRGWVGALDLAHRQIFETALCGFYKLSGVGLVREQLDQVLREPGAEPPPYHVTGNELRVWPGGDYETELAYDLRSARLSPKLRGARLAGSPPILAGRHAVFAREPLYWSVWVSAWQRIARGEPPGPLLSGPSLLGPAPDAPAAC